jgi:hypothetical protein
MKNPNCSEIPISISLVDNDLKIILNTAVVKLSIETYPL